MSDEVRVAIERGMGNLAEAGLIDADGLAAEWIEATRPAVRYHELLDC